MKFVLLIADTNRSKKYLDSLCNHNLYPEVIFFYARKKNKVMISKIKKNKIRYRFFLTNSINNSKISSEILSSKTKSFIYSGYPGEIVSSKLTRKKSFIHCHTGLLPRFKGSTTIYYSLLMSKNVYCSCIKLNNKIDEGKVLYVKKFKIPKNLNLIENKFDSQIRSETLISFLRDGHQKINKSENKKYYAPYYIAHPIIRELVLKKYNLNLIKKL